MLSAFFQFGFERLATFGSFARKEIGIIWHVEDELRKLHRTSSKIQDLLDQVDSSPLRFSGGSRAWQTWFEEVRKLSYDADGLLDHVFLHLSKFNRDSGNAYPEKDLRNMILKSLQLDLPHEITQMQKKLEGLAQEMKDLRQIGEKKDIRNFHTRENSYNSSSLVDEGVIVGREEDKQTVINFLADKNDFSIISLVGIGGIGKTSLAQLIFNDKDVLKDFKEKIWVSVFDFDVVRITKCIIESATKKSCTLSDLNSLQQELQKILISRQRLLLVLDDYWNENQDDWDLLVKPIRSAFRGSKVIVTTRSIRVSRIVGSIKAHNLLSLSDEHCWLLMKQRAFQRGERDNLESLGMEIAKKCKGLPLAAKTLGSVLQNCEYSTEAEWRSILKSGLWDLPRDGNNAVFASLMMSYLHLPTHLKNCFAYCSIFPQDHNFEVEEMVHLWIAQGFIQTGDQERSAEEVGNDYFHDLQSRFFFERGTSSSNTTTYRMSPLIHDLACLVSKDTCFQLKLDMLNRYPLFGNACHLSLHLDNVEALELKASHKNERLRTFLVMCKGGVKGKAQVDKHLFQNLKFVRVLYLSNIGLDEVPDAIEHLIYLRYINLSRNENIKRLPKSLCNLLALQTLNLGMCPNIHLLPDELKNLSNLRHLIFYNLNHMPPEIGKCTNLQTISSFVVGTREGNGIEELEKLDLLGGTLSIKKIQNVTDESNASKAKLHMKPYLNKLEFIWDELDDEPEAQQAQVLTNLQPHENVKEVVILNYSGLRCPDWLIDSHRKFTSICLYNLGYCKTLPAVGQLPHLKELLIGQMKSVDCVGDDFYGAGTGVKFRALESLVVYEMKGLVEWNEDSNGSDCMPHLETFKILDCPIVSSLPSRLRAVRNPTIYNCPLIVQTL